MTSADSLPDKVDVCMLKSMRAGCPKLYEVLGDNADCGLDYFRTVDENLNRNIDWTQCRILQDCQRPRCKLLPIKMTLPESGQPEDKRKNRRRSLAKAPRRADIKTPHSLFSSPSLRPVFSWVRHRHPARPCRLLPVLPAPLK